MTTVIDLMKELGMPTNEAGVCYGIANTALQAHARGELNQFLRRMALVRICPLDKLVEKIEKSHLKKAKPRSVSSSVVPEVLESYDEIDAEYGGLYDSMHAFLQTILFYHSKNNLIISDPVASEVYQSAVQTMGVATYPDYQSYQKFISVDIKNKESESKYEEGDEVKEDLDLPVIAADMDLAVHQCHGKTILSLNEEMVGKFITYLNGVEGDVALSFKTAAHAFALFKTESKWIVVNHDTVTDFWVHMKVGVPNAVYNALKRGLTVGPGVAVPVYIENFSSNVDLLADYESEAVWMDPKSDLYSVLYLAMDNGCYDIVSAYRSYLNHCFENDELSEGELVAALSAKGPDGSSGLYIAMQNGRHQSVIVYGDVLKGFADLFKRTPGKLTEILIAKNTDDLPALYMAMQLGNHQAIEAYGDMLKKCIDEDLLSRDIVKEILLTNAPDGIVPLYIAMQNGCHEAIRAYSRLLNSLLDEDAWTPEELKENLLAKTPHGFPALFMAMQLGNHQAIEAYGELLSDLFDKELFNAKELTEILLAKNPNDFPALFIAMEKGHHDAISAYGDILTKFIDKDLLGRDFMKKLIVNKRHASTEEARRAYDEVIELFRSEKKEYDFAGIIYEISKGMRLPSRSFFGMPSPSD